MNLEVFNYANFDQFDSYVTEDLKKGFLNNWLFVLYNPINRNKYSED
jgi:hypothetical protein